MTKTFGFSTNQKRILYVICLSALVLGIQLRAINRPFLGHYASYQATVMASISRNMLRENFSELLLPKTDSIIGGKRSLHLNQYPFPSLVAALGLKLFGGSFEFWGRFQAIVCNAVSIILLGLIAQKLFHERTAWIAATVYALSPFTLIYGQTFMSESMSLTFLLLSLFLLLKLKPEKSSFPVILFSALSFSISVTGRIHLILFYPLFAFLAVLPKSKNRILNGAIFSFIALAMPAAWYMHTYFAALNVPNIHTNIFLQASAQNPETAKIILTADYWRKVLDIISQMLLTPLLFPFFLIAPFLTNKKGRGFWIAMSGAIFGLLVLFLIPEKIMKHDFYLYGTFPFIVLVVAFGIEMITEKFPILKTNRAILFFILIYLGISSRVFLHPIFSSPPDKQNVVRVGKIIQAKTQPVNSLIVFGDDPATMLYYSDRAGWPLQPNLVGKPLLPYQKNPHLESQHLTETAQLEAAMKDPVTWFKYLETQGASYLVASVKSELDSTPSLLVYLKKNHEMLSRQDDDFYLFKISHKH